jgi:hypothetical protein
MDDLPGINDLMRVQESSAVPSMKSKMVFLSGVNDLMGVESFAVPIYGIQSISSSGDGWPPESMA